MLAINVDKIRVERTLRRWSQTTLAEKSGLSYYFVSRIERGKDNNKITLDIVGKLAKAFDITPFDLLEEVAE